eukprot:636699_1
MAFLAFTFLLLVVIDLAEGFTIDGLRVLRSTDFYYRAIAATTLRVAYYSHDHSNILNTQTLTEIHAIEQQIQSWAGYHNHSIVYKETNQDIKQHIGLSPLYLEGPPTSALNYMFPRSILANGWMTGNISIMTGDGDTFNDQWAVYMDAFNDLDDMIWFNPNAFDISAPSSPFLISNYPFGYQNEDESRTDLIKFVESFDSLLDSITSQNIFIRHSYSNNTLFFPTTLSMNGQIYQYQQSGNVSRCHSYNGYSTKTGDSSQAMQAVPDPFNVNLTINPFVDPLDHEECREKKWPTYLADNNVDAIRFDNYRWNMVLDDNEYYCTVMVENVSFCDGQWQAVDDGQYADIDHEESDDNVIRSTQYADSVIQSVNMFNVLVSSVW